ncbi:hypothetical protein [Lewinella sp. W8]|uniref:hypothetical protein n=1 Tax=Lewinella sp. W8 TaxID=2528208 RepID=UPI00106793E5|nr:hypothetical protein [Lewinella sp. W8]MTB51063.1 hypothetical protein [Lewinella sp. W8]
MQWLPRQEIDEARWDAAIGRDAHPLPYGLHWWLDTVAPGGWSAIVLEDYRAVLPLPKADRFIPEFFLMRSAGPGGQVQRPPFTQQLGPFGTFSPAEAGALLRLATQKAKLKGLPLAATISRDQIPDELPLRVRTNFVLPLSSPHETLFRGYGKTLRKQLRKYGPHHLDLAAPALVIDTYQRSLASKTGLRTRHFAIMAKLIKAALVREQGYCYQLSSPEGDVLAAGFFPEYRGRIINLFAASTARGYEQRGMARLIDAVIQRHQPTASIFDFEGSDLPGVKEFFQSFGPQSETYWSVG